MKIYKLQNLIKERFGESKLADNWAANAMITASRITLNLNEGQNHSIIPPEKDICVLTDERTK